MFYTAKPKRRWLRACIIACAVVAVAGGIFAAGFSAGRQADTAQEDVSVSQKSGALLNRDAPPPYLLQDVDFGLFWDVWRIAKGK